MREGGCSENLRLGLAARRGGKHPKEAPAVYESRIEPPTGQTDAAAHEEAREPLAEAGVLTRRLNRRAEFEEYLGLTRTEHKRKRNFVKPPERLR